MQTIKPRRKKVKRLDPYAALPKDVRKKVIRLIKQAKLRGVILRSAQRTIPYRQILREGLCWVEEDFYTKTVEFFDINYRLAKEETQDAIFEDWCDFLNYFDWSISVQLTFVNQKIDLEQFYEAIAIPRQEEVPDERTAQYTLLQALCEEYEQMLQNQLAKGNNGLIKRKFLTFGIHADSMEQAQQRLDRMENELLSRFKLMHVVARHQNGYQRMETLHDILNIGTDRKLNFNWGLIAKTGFTTKDFIAPNSLCFRKNTFELERLVGRASFLKITAPKLGDDILADFLDLDTPLVVSIHLQSIDQTAAQKQAKRMLADLNAMKADEQKKAFKTGYDPDMLPPDLVTYINEATALIDDLENRNERMFLTTFSLVNFAQDEEELESIFLSAQQLAQQRSCELLPLDWQQEAGLMSALPIGRNAIEIRRQLPTSSAAIFVPFMSQELFQPGGMYYGVNAVSGNMIMLSRLNAPNPNGLFLGVPGSGKSFASKREIVNVILTTPASVLILDPEREYTALVNALGGQVIVISADSAHYINPMDLVLAQNEEDAHFDPIRDKSAFLMSFCAQVMGRGDAGLEPIEMTLIDRCVTLVYADYLRNPQPENVPILGDLHRELLRQKHPAAQNMADALELYVTGSFNVFNHRTNVEIHNRLVCFDTKDLGQHLKPLGMLTVQDQIWARVRSNRQQKVNTFYYADEFHLLLADKQTAEASTEIWKRFRKWGGVPTGITQNVSDFLISPQIKNIFSNSPFVYLLNQAAGDQKILAEELNISEHQLTYVTNSQPGEGLLIFGGTIIPFVDHFPKDTRLYSLMTTKLDEVQDSGAAE